MVLAPSQWKNGLVHPSVVVRDAVLEYYQGAFCRDPAVTWQVVRAVENHGWRDYALWPHRFCSLPLNDKLLRWVIRQLERTDAGRPKGRTPGYLRNMVSEAPLASLARNKTKVFEVASVDTPAGDRIARRLELANANPLTSWRQLVAHCELATGVEDLVGPRIDEATLLLEPIARAGRSFSWRVLQVLSNDCGDGDDAFALLTGLMITLAGQLRLDEAVGAICDKFRTDNDWYHEESLRALTRIGSPTVVSVVRRRHPRSLWYVRNYLIGVLQNLHARSTVPTILALVESEDDDFLRGQLGLALAMQFDEGSANRARDLYWEAPDDPERGGIRNALVALSHLGSFGLPERDEWERAICDEWQDLSKQLQETA